MDKSSQQKNARYGRFVVTEVTLSKKQSRAEKTEACDSGLRGNVTLSEKGVVCGDGLFLNMKSL
jgi:hypothetical protein